MCARLQHLPRQSTVLGSMQIITQTERVHEAKRIDAADRQAKPDTGFVRSPLHVMSHELSFNFQMLDRVLMHAYQ